MTDKRDPNSGRFLAGNNGGGRKLGSRSKLTTQFLEDLRTVWTERGIEAMQRMAIDEPGGLVRVVAGLLPKEAELTLKQENVEQLTDQQILQWLADTQSALAELGFSIGAAAQKPDPRELN